MKTVIAALATGTLIWGASMGLAANTIDHRVSVREVMVSAITPATNTLWAADDPATEEAWQELVDAAVVVIAAGSLVKDGGAGPADNAWAAEEAWQAFSDTMIAAGVDALGAARAKDFDALVTATEVMYPPCEECHAQFHPDMR